MRCFWAKPWLPAWAAHRFPVMTQASLGSELTSLETEHTLKSNGASSNLTLKASTPTTGEHTLPLIRLQQPQNKEEASPNSQGSLWTHNTLYIKGIMASTLRGKIWQAFIPKTDFASKILGLSYILIVVVVTQLYTTEICQIS